MAKVVIIGATGFVGGALVRYYVKQEWQVVGMRRASSKLPSNLQIDWVEADILQPDSLEGSFVGADCIIHAAGKLGEAGVPEEAYHRLHVDGTRHVMDAVRMQAPQARVLYVSSPGVLGPIAGQPADEDTPLAPSNPYERSKAAAEQLVMAFAAQGLDAVIVRPEFMYGPHDTHVLGLFTAIKRGIFFYIGNGQATCHPTFIDDAVHGMALCLDKGQSGEIYHITGPSPVTFQTFGETMADSLGVKRPWLKLPRSFAMIGAWKLELLGRLIGIKPPLSRTGVAFFSENRAFSWQKAQALLEYTPRYDLRAGVDKTVRWYQEEGWL